MSEQPLGPGRIVLFYVPDIRRADQPITPFPAVVVEVDPDTGYPSIRALFPWPDRSEDSGLSAYNSWHAHVKRVEEGESRAWRWDWPNLQTWAWRATTTPRTAEEQERAYAGKCPHCGGTDPHQCSRQK